MTVVRPAVTAPVSLKGYRIQINYRDATRLRNVSTSRLICIFWGRAARRVEEEITQTGGRDGFEGSGLL